MKTDKLRYFKRKWEESRGDEFDHWGKSFWFFETEESGWIERQVMIFENGTILKYDLNYLEDEYGGLGEQKLDLEEFQEFEIEHHQFEQIWGGQKAYNRTEDR